jgi:glycerol uptake facilitator-like aquaporin
VAVRHRMQTVMGLMMNKTNDLHRQALDQLWLFWLAPIAGAVLARLVYKYLYQKDTI